MLTATVFAKLVIAFVITLTYPTTDDVLDTFGMDMACNMDPDCAISINRGESSYVKVTTKVHGSGTGQGNSRGVGRGDAYGALRARKER